MLMETLFVGSVTNDLLLCRSQLRGHMLHILYLYTVRHILKQVRRNILNDMETFRRVCKI